MKNKIVTLFTAAFMTLLLVVPVMADTYNGADNWSVEFTSGKEMVSNFSTADMQDTLKGLQPGDDANFKVSIANNYSESTDWYMSNAIIQSLEDASYNKATAGGAYTYKLTYTDTNGNTQVLFSSDEVGGDDVSNAGEGLNEATSGLEDFFMLDTLNTGDSGYVELYVALDGETQNNDYQDTLAELQVNFAVELNSTTVTSETTTTAETTAPTTTSPSSETNSYTTPAGGSNKPSTGDRTGSPVALFIVMGCAGITIIAALVVRAARTKKNEGE